ncbi:MAG: hypothetical protein JWM71_1008 [Solirubrobacteraceae bacterium]|nr:hypothetical protein [Solirubrobacteraceae bacterium]
MRRSVLAVLPACAAMLVGCGGSATSHAPATAKSALATQGGLVLVREHSGLLIDVPFRKPISRPALLKQFELNGSALPAHRRASSDARGLHVGVTRHAAGRFEGYFAVTHAAYPASSVFSVRMTRPPAVVTNPKQSGEAVFAVQTGSTKRTGLINYVVVSTFTSSGLFHELVGYAHGKIADATTKVLWESPYAKHRPATLDIALRTDGSHTLEVWIGGRLAYVSHHLNMAIAPPFQPYLEVQGLGIAYTATFQDFSVAGADTLTVRGLKPGSRVVLTPQGSAPVSSTAGSDGTAVLTLGVAHARGNGSLEATSGGHSATLGPFAYAGGDVLRVRAG